MSKKLESTLMQVALKAGNVGVWLWNLKTNEIEFSGAWKAQLGYTDEELLNKFEEFETRLHPDDHDRVLQTARAFIENPVPGYRVEFRLRHKDGSYHWIVTGADLKKDPEGRPEWMMGCNIDITVRKKMEQELGSTFDSAPIGMALLAPDGHWLKVNQAFCDIVGYSEQALLKTTIQALTHPDDWEAGANLFHNLVSGEIRSYHLEKRYCHKDGRIVWVQKSVSLVNDDTGAPVHFIAQIQDITERKKLAETLRTNEERLRLIARSAKDLLWDWDVSTNVLWWNESIQTALGYRAEDIEPGIESWENRIHPDDRETVLSNVHKVIDSGQNDWVVEYRFRRADGSYSYFLDRGYVSHREAKGKPIRVLGSMVDITERKRMEEALLKSEQLNRNLVEHLPHRILVKDRDSVILSCNANYAGDLGLSPATVIGTTAFALYPSQLAEAYRLDDLEVMASGKTKDIEEPYQVTGEERWVHTVKVPYRDEQQRVIGVLAVFEDITPRKQAEAELQLAKVAAESANRAKSEFLASMSHEIRTPMNGIIGMTGLLLETELTPEQRDYAETVQRSSDLLLGIINNILDFSKIEAGKLTLEAIDFDLRTMIEETLDLFAEAAQRKGLEVGSLLHAEVPTALRGDPGRLRQILVNLIGNALKFTQQGEVMIHVTRGEETADRVLLDVAVTDTGIGITSEAQARLFQVFSQADASTTRKFGGTGLGLAICKQLVDLMGGQIGIESEPGHGSTFRFTVWLTKQPAEAHTLPRPTGSLTGRRVCIVDDHATNRRILEQYVLQWGLQSASASDGYQALALMRDAASRGEPFDLAILDLQMPRMDGLELGGAITADPTLASTRLVLLTSVGLQGQAEKATQAGIAAYLTKPVHRAQLYDCLSLIVDRPEDSAVGARVGGTASRPTDVLVTRHVLKEIASAARLRILVVEDNSVNQKVAAAQLGKLGYRADVVANGLEAVDAVARIRYALVLMDCQMPEMDGWEATAVIRTQEKEQGSRRLPIIAMTANAMLGDREKCLEAGMDDYLSKPVKQGDLGAMLAQWIPNQSSPEDQGRTGPRARGPECVDAGVLAEVRN